MNIWLLSDGASGHLSQSRGLADAIARFRQVDTIEVPLRVKHHWLKSLLRHALPLAPSMSRRMLPQVYEITLPQAAPHLVISSGGNTLLASAMLASMFKVPNLYSGTRKGYPPRAYTRIYSVTPQGGASNVVLPLPPVPGELLRPMPSPGDKAALCLLIGGSGAGYDYRQEDWIQLCMAVNQKAQESAHKWLISTSRRTGAEAESLLEKYLDPTAVSEIVYYGRAPKPVVREFIARSGAIFVTEDSLTMVAEAIYSGRPTISVQPRIHRAEANDEQALRSYAANGFLTRVPIPKIADRDFARAAAQPSLPDIQALIYSSLADLLPEVRP